MSSKENLLWLKASLELLYSFFESNGKRFYFAGSSAEYGTQNELCRENLSLMPENLYGRCKAAFSQTAETAFSKETAKFTELRFFPVYGEGDIREKAAVPQAIRSFLSKQEFLCKSPENEWDFIYKDDAAAAALAVFESEFNGIVNIAGGKPIKMRDVFSEIAKAMNSESLLKFSEDKKSSRLAANTNILNNEINFKCETTFTEGIRKTVKWWQKRANL
jgi:nucleoside-diphosphate-sugar epimerase